MAKSAVIGKNLHKIGSTVPYFDGEQFNFFGRIRIGEGLQTGGRCNAAASVETDHEHEGNLTSLIAQGIGTAVKDV